MAPKRGRSKAKGHPTDYYYTVRDAGFAKRLNTACDAHPHVPALHLGRLTWIAQQFKQRFDSPISVETVRKWFGGFARPRPEKMKHLAELLGADEAWLSLGISPDLQPSERKARNAMAAGVVNLVAGLISAGGGHPAFPEKEGAARSADLSAVIKGGLFTFHVSLANRDDKGRYQFTVPANFAEMTVIGAVQRSAMDFVFLLLDTDSLARLSEGRGGFHELSVTERDGRFYTGKHRWARIVDFGGPLKTE